MQESDKSHQKNLLKMVVEESFWYFILEIWDGRYAAFWKDGVKLYHCIAVSEQYISDCGWPFAFISNEIQEVRDYIILGDLDMVCGAFSSKNLSEASDSLDELYKRKSGWFTKKHKNSFNYFRALNAIKHISVTQNETLKLKSKDFLNLKFLEREEDKI